MQVPPTQQRDRVTAERKPGVVIGQTCRKVPESSVEDIIAGYLPVIDISAEDVLQRYPGFLTRAKSFDTSLVPGPTIAVPDESDGTPDLAELTVRTEVNGDVAAANDIAMLFPPAEIVAFYSDVMTLTPGELLSTGTPGATQIEPRNEVRATVESTGSVRASVTW